MSDKPTKPITIKDLFFTLPAEGTRIPAQRCRVKEFGGATVTVSIVKADRVKSDGDGEIEYDIERFLNLPIVTWGGSVLISERDLPRIKG